MAKKNMEERIKMVKAMEYIARQINDENIFGSWLTVGVADGDIEYGDLTNDPGEAEFYAGDNDTFAELMGTFLKCMARAKKSGGLYCNSVVSKD